MMLRKMGTTILPVVALLLFANCGEDPPSNPGQPDNNEDQQSQAPKDNPEDKQPDDAATTSAGDSGGDSTTTTTTTTTGGDDSEPTGEDTTSDGDTSSPEDETDPEDDGKIDCSKLQSTGSDIGQIPGNAQLLNVKGEKVSLHDYCNDVLLVMLGSAF